MYLYTINPAIKKDKQVIIGKIDRCQDLNVKKNKSDTQI